MYTLFRSCTFRCDTRSYRLNTLALSFVCAYTIYIFFYKRICVLPTCSTSLCISSCTHFYCWWQGMWKIIWKTSPWLKRLNFSQTMKYAAKWFLITICALPFQVYFLPFTFVDTPLPSATFTFIYRKTWACIKYHVYRYFNSKIIFVMEGMQGKYDPSYVYVFMFHSFNFHKNKTKISNESSVYVGGFWNNGRI